MGYQDRDYFQSRNERWYWRSSGTMCRLLVSINVVIFIIQILTAPGLALSGFHSQGFFTDALVMDPVAVFEHGQVWRLFTSFFLHSPFSIWHIVFNMIVLWFFGSDMEAHYGPKEFLAFYLAAGVISSLIWGVCAYWLEPIMHASFAKDQLMSDEAREFLNETLQHRTALGASGAVTAVMILCAWHYPDRIIYVYFISVPLWLVAVIYVGMDFIVLYQGVHTGTGVAAHLAGAAFATLYYYFNWRILDLGLVGQDFWDGLTSWRRPRLRIHRESGRKAKRLPLSPTSVDNEFDRKVDTVLAKLKDQGREKLTAEELETLQQASERYRNRRS